MSKSNYSTTIAIDFAHSAFHFYSMTGNDRETVSHHIKSFTGNQLGGELIAKFKEAVKDFAEGTPSESIRKVTVILPDSAVLTDAVKIPTLKGAGQTKKALEITLGGLYKNYNDLRVISRLADQNKQYSTFAIAAVQKNIVSSIYAACSENKLLVDTLTFASNAAVGGAVLLNPKLKNASYLFLDIKDIYSRFVFVANGRVTGCYNLPFGLEFLRKPTVTQEDMLFDHSYAELVVLNAREKAKSKKLTVMSLDSDSEDSENETEDLKAEFTAVTVEGGEIVSNEDGQTQEDDAFQRQIPQPKLFTRKAPRKLPKFMLREVPETKEGILFENFRVFVKWVLTLIQSNEALTSLGKPEFVCVNIPNDLAYVLDAVNAEAEENGISFNKLPCSDGDAAVSSNLELYGGLFPKQISYLGKF